MRSLSLLAAWVIALSTSAATQHADSTGLAGDGFSLRAALEMFRQAKDLDAFEQALNTTDNHVNNLDLDNDGEVDYVHVRTQAEGESRVVVMQVSTSKEEAQDIAAIQMERGADGSVKLQIRGDELLYPENTIVEPTEEVKEMPGKARGPLAPAAQMTVWVNVWGWPSVQWCYGPLWWSWNTSWYWGYYPTWWRPWRPWGWRAWWGFPRPYYGWYQPVNVCRVTHANSVYMHRRSVSAAVQRRPDVRPAGVRNKDEARPAQRTVQPGINERTKETRQQPRRSPTTKPTQRPSERTAPTKQPQRQAPARSPSRSPSRQPQRAPTKR